MLWSANWVNKQSTNRFTLFSCGCIFGRNVYKHLNNNLLKLKVMQQSKKSNSVMETETIQKNEASPKSHTIRGNFKIFTLLGFFALFELNTMAQDMITLKSGDEITALVQEIGTDDVKYKKWNNQTGPTYTLKKAEIFMIKYKNGEKDVFNEIAKLQETKAEQYRQTPQANQSVITLKPEQITPGLSTYKYTFGGKINPVGNEKSPGLAGFLSFVMPGLGQFYNGDIGCGFVDLGLTILWGSSLNSDDTTIQAVGAGCLLLTYISSMVNAYKIAKRVNIVRGYSLGNNMHLNVNPTMLKTNDVALQNFNNSAYGLSVQVSF
jgi:TM2 domain-containing membrane protein YozV